MTTKAKSAPTTGTYPYKDLKLTQIIPNPRNIRHEVKDIDGLTASVKEFGVLSNLVVAPADTADKYVLIAGHRRYAAAQAAGLATVKCAIRTDLTDEAAQVQAMLDENKQRSNLNDVEEGDAFQLLLDHGFTAAAIATRNSTPTRYVQNRIKVAKAPESVRAKVIAEDAGLDEALTVEKYKSQPALYKALTAALGTNNWAFALKRAEDALAREKAGKEAIKRQKRAVEELKAEGIRVLQTAAERDSYLVEYEDKNPGVDVRWEALGFRPRDADSADVAAWWESPLSSLRWFRLIPDVASGTEGSAAAATAASAGADRSSRPGPIKKSFEEQAAAAEQAATDLRIAADCRHEFLAKLVKARTVSASKAKDPVARDAAAAAVVASTEWLDTDELIAAATIVGRELPDDLSELDLDEFLPADLEAWTLTASLEALAIVNLIVDRVAIDNMLATRTRAWLEKNPTRDAWLRELENLGYAFSDVETRLIAERAALADDE